jgi:hypothetical protein
MLNKFYHSICLLKDKIINELNDVKILEIISNDKEALDKKFTLQIVRYQEGKPDTVFTNGKIATLSKYL